MYAVYACVVLLWWAGPFYWLVVSYTGASIHNSLNGALAPKVRRASASGQGKPVKTWIFLARSLGFPFEPSSFRENPAYFTTYTQCWIHGIVLWSDSEVRCHPHDNSRSSKFMLNGPAWAWHVYRQSEGWIPQLKTCKKHKTWRWGPWQSKCQVEGSSSIITFCVVGPGLVCPEDINLPGEWPGRWQGSSFPW